MLGKQGDNTDLFQLVTMDALVPANHRLRRLHAVLDMSFVAKCVADLYSNVGRTSIAPEVVVRMWLLQYLHGYSERELCEEMQMHAGFRWFCGLSFNDKIPDQSTLVKLRTKMWANSGIHEAFLKETIRACEAAGIASTSRLGVDGTLIQANAATVSLEEIPAAVTIVGSALAQDMQSGGSSAPDNSCMADLIDDSLSKSLDGVIDIASQIEHSEQTDSNVSFEPLQSDRRETVSPSGSVTNETPHSTTSSELQIQAGGRRNGKHRSGDPDWHGEKFSNSTHRSTTDTDARLYRKSKNQDAKLRYMGHYLTDIKSGVIYGAMATQATGTAEREATLVMLDKLSAMPSELAMDLGYRDGNFLSDILERGITPMVPIGDQKLEEVPTWKRPASTEARQAKRNATYTAVVARNTVRLANRGRHATRAQRQRTKLEHLFAEGKNNHGLAQARVRGTAKVDQQVKLTAGVQNLKRLLKTRRRRNTGGNIATCGQNGTLLRVFMRKLARTHRRSRALHPFWAMIKQF